MRGFISKIMDCLKRKSGGNRLHFKYLREFVVGLHCNVNVIIRQKTVTI